MDKRHHRDNGNHKRKRQPSTRKKKDTTTKELVTLLGISAVAFSSLFFVSQYSKKESFDYSNLKGTQVKDIKPLDAIEKSHIVSSFVQTHELNDTLIEDFRNCASHNIYTFASSMSLEDALHNCLIEYRDHGESFAQYYYDLDNIAMQFNSDDGSHFNSISAIKDNISNPDSFKHIKTNYWVSLFNQVPYLYVNTTFTKLNYKNVVTESVVSIKVDIENGDLLALEKVFDVATQQDNTDKVLARL